MNIIYIIIAIILILLIAIILIYNHLVTLNNRCNNAWSQIDNQLKRRYDLIPNLIEVTKGYANHERQTLVETVNKRVQTNNLSEIAKESEEVSKGVKKLLAVAESYPDLKANELFKNLQIELTGTEDKIAFARQFYNDSVQDFNTAIEIFPNNILANILNYKSKNYFKVKENERNQVKINLWF